MTVALVIKDLFNVKSERTTKLDIEDLRTEIEKGAKDNALCGLWRLLYRSCENDNWIQFAECTVLFHEIC
jgi:hypothetical protein